jgi:CheY-like chemotaxis protein
LSELRSNSLREPERCSWYTTKRSSWRWGKNIGYRVLTAKEGKEAIKLYKENQDNIDIVVLNLVMPVMGGGQAYDRMKKINPNIKVLLSSGVSIDGKASEILERGCRFCPEAFRHERAF